MTKEQLQNASREELQTYLESWGFAVYPHETTESLREAALQNQEIEGSEH